MRNSKVLNPEIISLDKSYATNAIGAGLKKKNIRLNPRYIQISECVFGYSLDSMAV
ncbi:hypothetical protein LEP1GSC187_3948 [Leptospira santarosai str. ZUN179]|uniref:Uncharacterized protein n=1 Tax=Leptospira santarosai str. ZUN179 TaxID=1049985 RepID=M6UGS0_9LEPT|nr:hypothetical protein LEP1GSC187_3948 [Leptospira santarosai str. ZUN179]